MVLIAYILIYTPYVIFAAWILKLIFNKKN